MLCAPQISKRASLLWHMRHTVVQHLLAAQRYIYRCTRTCNGRKKSYSCVEASELSDSQPAEVMKLLCTWCVRMWQGAGRRGCRRQLGAGWKGCGNEDCALAHVCKYFYGCFVISIALSSIVVVCFYCCCIKCLLRAIAVLSQIKFSRKFLQGVATAMVKD